METILFNYLNPCISDGIADNGHARTTHRVTGPGLIPLGHVSSRTADIVLSDYDYFNVTPDAIQQSTVHQRAYVGKSTFRKYCQ